MTENDINIVNFANKAPNFATGLKKTPTKEVAKETFPMPSERFLSMTAHEMQVPITSLSWNMERLLKVLGEEANKPDVTKVLKRISEANTRLVTLVEDLLNVAKMQEGAFLVAKRPMQLVEVVRRALRTNEREALKRGVVVKWSADSAQIPLTIGDPERIYQVTVNILSNAVKYTPRGGTITVTVRKTREIAPADVVHNVLDENIKAEYVVCSIEDTGIGIAKEEQVNIFTQFFRGQKAVATDESGTGLGLFLVKKIIEQHDGAIWFSSREGYGSTFFFTLPVMDPYENNNNNAKNSGS
ncbi:MAG: HAMP domain-containing sensor histidine kinase [bacterium]|nr:HAMP domain-containing sensor histidine kinase [bacterium]